MDQRPQRTVLGEGVTGVYLPTDRFKTQSVALSLAYPITPARSAQAALLSRLLSRSTAAYPSHTLLHRHLADLYGASFGSFTHRVGDCEILCLTCSVLEDAYALEGEPLTRLGTDLLLGALFEPHLVNGGFEPAAFESEKRQLIETVEGLLNDKRGYALEQAQQLLYPNEPSGIPDSGGLDEVRAVQNADVVACWRQLLATARVQVTVIGRRPPQEVYAALQTALGSVERAYAPLPPTKVERGAGAVREKTEPMDVAQGKLVLGFTTGVGQGSSPEEIAAMQLTVNLWGGAPYSRLFTVVREQMSLCYYCAARFQEVKGAVIVDSGIEVDNVDRVRQGVLDQLEVMRQGAFTDEELAAARKGVADGVRGVNDSASALEGWYIHHMLEEDLQTPEDLVRLIETVPREALAAAAGRLHLDAVYFLKGE